MDRLNRLANTLKENQYDSIFITSKANIYYVSNYYTDPHERLVAVYATKKDTPLLILPAMEKQQALDSGWKGDILSYTDDQNPWLLFQTYLADANKYPNTMAIEKDHISVERFEYLTKASPETTIYDAKELLANLRVIKDKMEYKRLKEAASFADLGVKVGIEAIQEGKTELAILAEIEYKLKKQGIKEMSFSTMVLSGKKTASPHGNPGLNKISPGDLVLFDLGVIHEGYCSDITRTVAYKQINEEQNQIYQTVLNAQKEAIGSATKNQSIGTIDKVARDYITNKGYGDYFNHRIGHGIGIEVHEYPSLTSTNDMKLREGMSFTIEPGIYVPNIGGVRIEDEIFITNKGSELLTSYPKELQIIQ